MMLKGRTWAAVNNFTIADLALTVTVAQLVSLRFDLEPYDRIRTWLERCKAFLKPHGYDVNQFKINLPPFEIFHGNFHVSIPGNTNGIR